MPGCCLGAATPSRKPSSPVFPRSPGRIRPLRCSSQSRLLSLFV
ncbi:hypothetical protein DVDV_3080 [Desulfovibrio sp. DV]|nr:hypothetical protein DVDV_3080 [Desulfovibrio sp. DV]